ncbi:MAG: hypothetical protein V4594_15215 [Bacteroidota bacterium]
MESFDINIQLYGADQTFLIISAIEDQKYRVFDGLELVAIIWRSETAKGIAWTGEGTISNEQLEKLGENLDLKESS